MGHGALSAPILSERNHAIQAMEEGLVSIVIPVHNGSRWLRQAIDSVLAQTYRPLELVAVDDGSTDESCDILSGYDAPLRIHRQENCGNVGLVRNAGMQQSRGEFIALLDQDDWWLPSKLARQVAIMRADKRVGLVHTAVRHFDESVGNECPPLNPHAHPERIAGDCFEELLWGNPIYNSSVLIRRAALDVVGRCDPRVPGNTVQDYDLWLRLAAKYHCGFVAEPLTVYRLHGSQGLWDRRAMLTAERDVLLRVRDELWWRQNPRGRERLAALYDDLAVAHLDQGESQRARECFRRACEVHTTLRCWLRYGASLLPSSVVQPARKVKQRWAVWISGRFRPLSPEPFARKVLDAEKR